jgi:hypothetical protein
MPPPPPLPLLLRQRRLTSASLHDVGPSLLALHSLTRFFRTIL